MTSLLRMLTIALIAALLPAAACSPPPVADAVPVPDCELIVLAGTLIDGTGGKPLTDIAILTGQGIIIDLIPIGDIDTTDPRVIDARGQTVLPGLFNTHVHLSLDSGRLYGRQGVTTVCDMGNVLMLLDDFRHTFASPGSPRLLMAAPILTAPGGHPMRHYPSVGYPVATAEEAEAAVRHLVGDHHVNYIKLAITDGWGELNRLDESVIQAIVRTAHSLDRRVFAHIDDQRDFTLALDAGVDVLAHMPYVYIPDQLLARAAGKPVFALVLTPGQWDIAVAAGVNAISHGPSEPLTDIQLRRAIDRDITLIPTLTYRDHPGVDRNAARFYELGGRLAVGDAAGTPFRTPGTYVEELVRLHERAGIPPDAVLAAAAANSARALGLADRGTIQPGMRSDLVVVAGDPLAHPAGMSDVVLVIRDGTIVYSRD